jgi:serine/threonine protein kinase
MLTSTATVEQGGRSVVAGRSSDGARFIGGGVMRFSYTTGSRPLDGYTIKRGIGRGGFGEVYFALSDAGKEVALKCIQQGMDVEIRGVSQCLNIKHPNLIGLFDIRYDDDGQPWVVMEYVAGQTLRDELEQAPNGLPLDQVQDWFQQITAAVGHLHHNGIVHRDLKPGNIFRDAGIVKIGDYGLSKYISASRRSGHTESVGTFHYMAPEIGRGIYGKEIDIYALGIILYEMLTGHLPFQGESSQEIMMKHLTAEPVLTAVPERFRAVLSKALRKDPAQRFHSVEELTTEFVAALNMSRPEPSVDEASPASPPVRRTTAPDPRYVTLPFGHQVVDEGIALGPLREVVPQRSQPGTGTFVTLHVSPRRGSETQAERGRNEAVQIAAAYAHPRGKPRAEEPLVIADLVSTERPTEPLAAAIGQIGQKLTSWWKSETVSNPLKAAVLLGTVAVVILNAFWLVPAITILGCVYAVYYIIFQLTVGTSSQTREAAQQTGRAPLPTRWRYVSPSQPVTQAAYQAGPARAADHRQQLPHDARKAKKVDRKRKKIMVRQALAAKPIGQRLAELNGSFLSAALVAIIVSGLVASIGITSVSGSDSFWAFVMWVGLTSTISAWGLLLLSQFRQASDEESTWEERGLLAALGALLGIFAAWMASFLELNSTLANTLASEPLTGGPLRRLESFLTQGLGQSAWLVFIAYFALVLALLRWPRQADPLRSSRFSLLSVGASMLTAWLVQLFLPFPGNLAILWALTTSIALQLSAPWLNTKQRESL